MTLSCAAVIYLLSITFTTNFISNDARLVEYIWDVNNSSTTSCVNDIQLKNSDCSMVGRNFCSGNRAVVFFTEKDCLQCHSGSETFSNHGENTGGYREASSIGLQCNVCMYGPAKGGDQCRDYNNDTVLTLSSGRQIGYLDKAHTSRTAVPIGITPIAYFSKFPRSIARGTLKTFWRHTFLNSVATEAPNRRRDDYDNKFRTYQKSMPGFYDVLDLNKERLQAYGLWNLVWCGEGKCFYEPVHVKTTIGGANLTANFGLTTDIYDIEYMCVIVAFYSIGDFGTKFPPGCFLQENDYAISFRSPAVMNYSDFVFNSYRPLGLAGFIKLDLDQVSRLESEVAHKNADSEYTIKLEFVLDPPVVTKNETNTTVKMEHESEALNETTIINIVTHHLTHLFNTTNSMETERETLNETAVIRILNNYLVHISNQTDTAMQVLKPMNETAIVNLVKDYLTQLPNTTAVVEDTLKTFVETVKAVDTAVNPIVTEIKEIEAKQTKIQKSILAVVGGASAVVFTCFTTLLVFCCYLWVMQKKHEMGITDFSGQAPSVGSTTSAFGM